MSLFIGVVVSGCGHPKGVIFEAPKSPLAWPPPPEPARIHYVGQIATEADLKPAKSFGKALGEAIFGKDPVRSMLSPYALCTDGGNRLFVADSNAQVVHVFDLETRVYEQWRPFSGEQESEVRGQNSEVRDQRSEVSEQRSVVSDQSSAVSDPQSAVRDPRPATSLRRSDDIAAAFAQPVGIAFDARQDQRRLFVADSVAGVVFVFNDIGKHIATIGADFLTRPCGLAIDAMRERLFIADTGTHQVFVVNLNTGELIERLGMRGIQLGQFNFPTNVAVDSLGRLYVSDSLNFRVQVFDENLKPNAQIGSHGDMPGYFSQPKGLALDSENHLYVIDAHFEAVQIFDTQGNFLLAFGEEGGNAGQFWLPAGIHIDANDRIWIADTYNRRVQVFDYRPEVRQ